MNRSMLGLPVHHQFPESTQTHVHWVGDAREGIKSSEVRAAAFMGAIFFGYTYVQMKKPFRDQEGEET